MRVYLLKSQKVPKGRAYESWGAPAFCEVPTELGEKWIKAGVAKRATDKNEIEEDEQPKRSVRKPAAAPLKKKVKE